MSNHSDVTIKDDKYHMRRVDRSSIVLLILFLGLLVTLTIAIYFNYELKIEEQEAKTEEIVDQH
jgi:hypothetical protein